jgi:hypothetical protein
MSTVIALQRSSYEPSLGDVWREFLWEHRHAIHEARQTSLHLFIGFCDYVGIPVELMVRKWVSTHKPHLLAMATFFIFCCGLTLATQVNALGAHTGEDVQTVLVTAVTPTPETEVQAPTYERIAFGALAGRKVGGLNAALLGIPQGVVPAEAVIHPGNALEHLWDVKLAVKGVTPATKKSAEGILKAYATQDPHKVTLHEYVAGVDEEIRLAREAIDWSAFCEKRDLSGDDCTLLKGIAYEITGRDLVAYSMTELLPSEEGKFNALLLEILLGAHGTSYLARIPALGDPMMSMDPYQFTSHAVYDTGDEVHGASVVNRFVDSSQKIHGSVTKLNEREVHRAAFYFAVYNLSIWVKVSTPAEKVTLRKKFAHNMSEITQLIAVAHHLPANAIRGARLWVSHGCSKSLQDYLGPQLRRYGRKTVHNAEGLAWLLEMKK